MSAATPNRKFATLDAIRGIAAVCVMGFHYALLDNDFPLKFSNAFIDVDLFFCLSGFVLMQAYGGWAEGPRGIAEFVKVRLIRLYPMYVIGIIIGIAAFEISSAAMIADGTGRLSVSILLAFLMLPDLSGTIYIPYSITNGIYPLNIPAWSLFFEVLANVALAARRWSQVNLLFMIAIAGVALAVASVALRTINGGFEASTMIIGLLRMSYNFAAGALLMKLFQSGLLARVALPPILPILGVIAISAVLPASGRLDLAVILLVVPFIIASATRDPLSRAGLAICDWLGRISYPLYAIHYPLVLLAIQAQETHIGRSWLIGSCAVFAIVLSDVLARTLDPIARQVLSRAFIEKVPSPVKHPPEWAAKG